MNTFVHHCKSQSKSAKKQRHKMEQLEFVAASKGSSGIRAYFRGARQGHPAPQGLHLMA